MAELSTLSPSPSALGDPHATPSVPSSSLAAHTPDLAMATSTPKCLTETTPAPQPEGVTSAPLPPQSPLKVAAETPVGALPCVCQGAAAQHEDEEAKTGAHVERQDLLSNEASLAAPPDLSSSELTAQPASPSTDLTPGPNLYPSVHVTHNPHPGGDDVAQPADGDATVTVEEKPQKEQVPKSPPPPVSPKPQSPPPPLSPKPQSPPPPLSPKPQSPLPLLSPKPRSPPPPVSPKPQSPIKAQPPCSPTTGAGHPSPTVPFIQEPAPFFPMATSRPAPDTLSYLESASLMSGTLESLSGLGEDGSSIGSDSEINGLAVKRTDKYGFLGGTQYSESGEKEVRIEVARQREMKWLEMFNNWDKWIKHRFQKVKMRCRKGIPSSLRSKAWQLLSNSQELLDANIGKFEELERDPGEAKWLDIIEKDLHRQFPFHEMFAARGGHGQQDLYRILKAYTIYKPDEGYCQAQAPVAAVLLMHMPAEQAFWCLVQICEKYLPGYYSAGLEAIQLDGEIFFSLLRRTCPMAYRHLKKFKIDPILYMTEWFMCIFSRTLPWACVLRVWDMFFCEGVKIVFRVGLVLLKQMLGSVDKLRELQGMYETMERLRSISPDTIREDTLVQEIILMQVTEGLIERECTIQVRKWRESRGELTHQPGRRLHGTRAIFEHKRRAASISSGGSFSFLASSIPPPGPLRASSSLLSLPGFRKSRAPFHTQAKKSSFSGPSSFEVRRPQSPPVVASNSASHKPPIPPGAGQRAPQVQSPLVDSGTPSRGPAPASDASSPNQSTPPPNTLSPTPRIVSEQITPTIPSPTANNTPLPLCVDPKKEVAEAKTPPVGEDGRKKKKSKEDKKKEREDEKKKLKEKREREKAEKEKMKKEKERLEKEKKKGGKKKDKGGAPQAEDKNGAAAARDSA
ncbi:TBC1 domain family member 10A-like [Entelurus aequoreus]|uniref:TBC1 domain family member 10A-like n=1 Tax=Entelurus aequoreus TaxID=161455 RepID=UPI002B1CF34E|nr:TBC1 domain family member 10A-like [Entelurus aequoreus]